MKAKTRKLYSLYKFTIKECRKDDIFTLSAALAFYFIFSLGPVIYVVAWITSKFIPNDLSGIIGTALEGMEDFIGPKGVDQIQILVENALISKTGWFFKLAGFPMIILIAIGTFLSLQKSLNKIWEIPAPKQNLFIILERRVIAFGFICLMAAMLIIFILLDALTKILETQIENYLPNMLFLIPFFNSYILEFSFLFILVFLVLKLLPDARLYWKDLIIGCAFTAFLFLIGKKAFAFFLSHTYFGNIYDAIGSIVLLLVWLYYNALIFYIGAEFTHCYSIIYGKGIMPKRGLADLFARKS